MKTELKKNNSEEKSGVTASKEATKKQALEIENWETALKQSENLKGSFDITKSSPKST